MKIRQLSGITLLFCCFAFVSAIAFGQREGARKDFAEISNQGSSIEWTINAQHKSVSLTVIAPDGKVFRREFPAGVSPVFSIDSSKGSINGSFKYEIVVTPVLGPEALAAMKNARRDGSDDNLIDALRKKGLLPEPLVQAGSFRAIDGQIFTGSDSAFEPDAVEVVNDDVETGTNTSDVERKTRQVEQPEGAGDIPVESVTVINMDLVVQGSQCLGIDCPTNPSFGFDTLRLMENNLRIKFEDTSNSASFPTNDWELTVNETTNGGLEKFSITDVTNNRVPFTVEANAAANSIYVDGANTGRVGFKTATPVVELHSRDGDTPTLRLEQDGSSGFGAQTWDVAGNEANFFVRDVTNSSRLVFKIKPGAPTSSIFVQNNGRIGLQTESPTRTLDVNGGIRLRSDVLEFPDGTTQSTAATSGTGDIVSALNVGGGTGVFKQKAGSMLEFKTLTSGSGISVTPSGADSVEIASTFSAEGAANATTIFGGSGTIVSPTNITPVVDSNSFGINTNSQAGFAVLNYNIPTNLNLSAPTGATTFRIRYTDPDGVGTASSVSVNLVTININGGNRTTTPLFNSNSNAATTTQTITVCAAALNFSGLGNMLTVALVGNASNTASLTLVQVFKAASCP